MAGYPGNDRYRGDECKASAAAAYEREETCKPAKQHQVHEDLDDLGRAQQVCAEMLDRLTSRLGPVLAQYPCTSPDGCGAAPEPTRCDIAGRVRSSYITVCDVNGRLQDLIDRLQV